MRIWSYIRAIFFSVSLVTYTEFVCWTKFYVLIVLGNNRLNIVSVQLIVLYLTSHKQSKPYELDSSSCLKTSGVHQDPWSHNHLWGYLGLYPKFMLSKESHMNELSRTSANHWVEFIKRLIKAILVWTNLVLGGLTSVTVCSHLFSLELKLNHSMSWESALASLANY